MENIPLAFWVRALTRISTLLVSSMIGHVVGCPSDTVYFFPHYLVVALTMTIFWPRVVLIAISFDGTRMPFTFSRASRPLRLSNRRSVSFLSFGEPTFSAFPFEIVMSSFFSCGCPSRLLFCPRLLFLSVIVPFCKPLLSWFLKLRPGGGMIHR